LGKVTVLLSNIPDGEIRVLAATGVLGSGFLESSFSAGLSRQPHFIGSDAGSSDPGPSPLGAGGTSFPARAIKRDLRIMLIGARQAKIPLLIGSCGTAGGDPHLQMVFDILQEIAREEGLKFQTALIHAEQDLGYLKAKLHAGKIKPLNPAPIVDEETIDRSTRIVGMMGAEPYLAALEGGADVVMAGRSSDTAIFAGIPTYYGFPEGFAWHAAKILECGAAAATHRKNPDCLMATITHEHFVIEPLDPQLRCTPQSVAAHSLYENADPYLITESLGTIDLRAAEYEAVDDRRVRVRGSAFIPADHYTVKLEGAELVGYQSVIIGSIRDPLIIGQIDDWLVRLKERVRCRVPDVFGAELSDDAYHLGIHVYGRNGTMRDIEPVKEILAHELCLLFEITAPTQEIASAIAAMTRHQALHLPIPEWSGLITGIACPFNPAYLERGPVYRFNVNHVVEVDDPLEMFRIEQIDVN
jgi:hypothetical protein